MNLKKRFSGTANSGMFVQKRRQFVPAPVTIHSVAIAFADRQQDTEKTIIIEVNNSIVFSGIMTGKEPHVFDPPLVIRPGFPTVIVTAVPFENGEKVSGRVVVDASLG